MDAVTIFFVCSFVALFVAVSDTSNLSTITFHSFISGHFSLQSAGFSCQLMMVELRMRRSPLTQITQLGEQVLFSETRKLNSQMSVLTLRLR